MPLLEIKDLHVVFDTPEGTVHAVNNVTLDVAPGETLGIVGESGCGKSVTAMSVLRLIPSPPGRIVSGSITFDGHDIATMPIKELRKLRGAAVGMVFQDPMTALSPLHRVGDQLVEALNLHTPTPRRQALAIARTWLEKAGIADPDRCLREYPFRLSGGQQQRVMIASVLMTNPRLIIADEPTTALDVTIQAQVLELMRRAKNPDTALLLITHNMGVVRHTCTRVAVMYAGEIVETGTVRDVFRAPRHPYTRALLDAMPSRGRPGQPLAAIAGTIPSPIDFPRGCRFHERCRFAAPECADVHPRLADVKNYLPAKEPDHLTRCPRPVAESPGGVPSAVNSECGMRSAELGAQAARVAESAPNSARRTPHAEFIISVRALHKKFKHVHAVNDVTLDLAPGVTLAIVGESGSGKTTLARMIAGLEKPTSGDILIDGKNVSGRRSLDTLRAVQMIFQDPFSSLNPRMTVAEIVTEAAVVHRLVKKSERNAFAEKLLADVGMPPEAAQRYAHEFSGGQRQRISIARAISLNPRVIICDEPVSALDVSVQAQVLNLLADLQRDLKPAYLFITHDIGVVRRVAHRIAVMHNGRIVEHGDAAHVLEHPQHPYTRTLLAAEPRIDLN